MRRIRDGNYDYTAHRTVFGRSGTEHAGCSLDSVDDAFRKFNDGDDRHRSSSQESDALAGEGVYDIYDGLIVPDVPADADPAENNVYIAARKALDDHFSPKKNADFEIYNFQLAKQLQH